MHRIWILVLLFSSALAQTLSPQQNFERSESQVQTTLSRIKDMGTQVGMDLKALEVEVGHLPPLVDRMQSQLQDLRQHYGKVRSQVAEPLTCVKRNDIAYAINGDLNYQLTGDLNYSLNQDLALPRPQPEQPRSASRPACASYRTSSPTCIAR